MDLFILYYTEDLKINNGLCWWALTLTYKCSLAGSGRGILFAHSRFFSQQFCILKLCHFNPEHRFFFSNSASRAKTLAKPACRETVKSGIPSIYFAFFRPWIPQYISDPERIPFLTLVLVSLWQRDNTPLKSAVSIRFDTGKTYAFRIKLTAKTVDEDPASCKRWICRKEI